MGEERLASALGRIERALARIEAAARPGPHPPAPDGQDQSGLRQAHLALRGKVESAIAQIDRILESEGKS